MDNIIMRLVRSIEVFDIDLTREILHQKFYSEEAENVFIDKLNESFDEFKDFGDTKLISLAGKCGSCDKRRRGYLFVGDKSNNYISFIISKKKKGIEIFKCSSFVCFEIIANLKLNIFDKDNPF